MARSRNGRGHVLHLYARLAGSVPLQIHSRRCKCGRDSYHHHHLEEVGEHKGLTHEHASSIPDCLCLGQGQASLLNRCGGKCGCCYPDKLLSDGSRGSQELMLEVPAVWREGFLPLWCNRLASFLYSAPSDISKAASATVPASGAVFCHLFGPDSLSLDIVTIYGRRTSRSV